MVSKETCNFKGMLTKEEYIQEMLKHKEYFRLRKERHIYYYVVNALAEPKWAEEDNANVNVLKEFLYDLINDYFDNHVEEWVDKEYSERIKKQKEVKEDD